MDKKSITRRKNKARDDATEFLARRLCGGGYGDTGGMSAKEAKEIADDEAEANGLLVDNIIASEMNQFSVAELMAYARLGLYAVNVEAALVKASCEYLKEKATQAPASSDAISAMLEIKSRAAQEKR